MRLESTDVYEMASEKKWHLLTYTKRVEDL